ncbi:MAG: PQQ-binding-like beta-propeller repeat protein, partial [Acidobacteria bacterium]|nr:PQQ-binding-like beta-propeller repeat protein [Acidobacteriota bacterium]
MIAVRLAALAGLAFAASSVDAGQAQPRREPATYTAEQADAGFAAYAQHCSSCHGENLDDGPFAPPLRGTAFREAWLPRSVEALFTLTSTTMPQDRPGVLDDETVTDLVALMLQENGVVASGTALPADPDLLAGLAPGWSSAGGGLSPGAALPPWPAPYNPLDGMQPVTDAALHDPPAGDWLLWRRTYAAYGYSPLDHIDRENVSDLRVAWSWSLPRGPNESTPIVRDGVLFVHGYGDRVQALDAAGGDFLWEYQRRLPRGVSPSLKRGMSIHGDRLFVPTSDAHVVALDAKTGDVVWDRQVGDLEAGLRMTGGTLVARGKVMVGT